MAPVGCVQYFRGPTVPCVAMLGCWLMFLSGDVAGFEMGKRCVGATKCTLRNEHYTKHARNQIIIPLLRSIQQQ